MLLHEYMYRLVIQLFDHYLVSTQCVWVSVQNPAAKQIQSQCFEYSRGLLGQRPIK